MFAVVVTFTLKPGSAEAFLSHTLKNARASLADEPGCHRFDVCTDPARPDEMFLHELYDDAAAFDAHLATPHFAVFDKIVGEHVAEKDVRTYSQVAP